MHTGTFRRGTHRRDTDGRGTHGRGSDDRHTQKRQPNSLNKGTFRRGTDRRGSPVQDWLLMLILYYVPFSSDRAMCMLLVRFTTDGYFCTCRKQVVNQWKVNYTGAH